MRKETKMLEERLGILEVRLYGISEKIAEPAYMPPELPHSDWEHARNHSYMGIDIEGN